MAQTAADVMTRGPGDRGGLGHQIEHAGREPGVRRQL
jgi:hypothetical protein